MSLVKCHYFDKGELYTGGYKGMAKVYAQFLDISKRRVFRYRTFQKTTGYTIRAFILNNLPSDTLRGNYKLLYNSNTLKLSQYNKIKY